jgi:hypothetical protein
MTPHLHQKRDAPAQGNSLLTQASQETKALACAK